MIGTQLAHYEILSAIGKGGMGEVWRARDTKLGREVAIKTLPPEFAQDADRLARFEREAKLLASLNHPNIAAIYGLEEHEGSRFLVLELVEGDTLADRLKHGAIPVEESMKLALQIAEALEAAHEKGVIHRDLKPANIKVTADGKVKVLDFGLAKAFAGEEADANLSNSPTLSMQATQAGIILGTAAYMSPEQAKGLTADRRADVFSFGCVLFEMLSGRMAFRGELVSEILASVINQEPDYSALQDNLHPRIQELLRRCFEKQPKDRWQAVGDVRVEIEQALRDPKRLKVQSVGRSTSGLTRRAIITWAGATLAVVALSNLAVWSLRPSIPRPVDFEDVLPDGLDFRGPSRSVLAISPDSEKFVYNTDDGLYLRWMGETPAALVPGAEAALIGPSFSPDSEWVVYWSDQQLKKILAVGGSEIPLATVGAPPEGISWDADDIILFDGPEGIMSVSSEGGDPAILIPGNGRRFFQAQLLPGGEAVLFHSDDGQIVVQSLDSSEPKELFPGLHARYVSSGHILYARDYDLFAVAFDLQSLEPTGGHVPVVEGIRQLGLNQGLQYSVSETGSLVYVPGGPPDESLTLALVDSEGVVEPLNVSPAAFSSPRVSPDGEQFAVERVEDDRRSAIWIYDVQGREPRRLTLEGHSFGPVWTPNGSGIAYFSMEREDEPGMFLRNSDLSGSEIRLTTASEAIQHRPETWHPIGMLLAFTELDFPTPPGGAGEIKVYSLETEESEPLFDESGVSAPAFSPSGNWIAYNQGSQVFVRSFPDTGDSPHQITEPLERTPVWSNDGSQLFSRRSGGAGVTRPILSSVEITTEPSVRLGERTELLVPDFHTVPGVRNFDIHPDGGFLMVMSPTLGSRPRIKVILDWFEELKERVPVP